jgi:hypothetical protein
MTISRAFEVEDGSDSEGFYLGGAGKIGPLPAIDSSTVCYWSA